MTQAVLQCQREARGVKRSGDLHIRPESPTPSGPREFAPTSGNESACWPSGGRFNVKESTAGGILAGYRVRFKSPSVVMPDVQHTLAIPATRAAAAHATSAIPLSVDGSGHMSTGGTQLLSICGPVDWLAGDITLGQPRYLKRNPGQTTSTLLTSNGRAEAAVKSAKRVLRGNIGADGNLDTDKATLALIQYHNTPLRDINKSPAQLATGRQLRDGVPTITQKLMVNKFWGQTLRQRERQIGQQHEKIIRQRGNTRQRLTLAPGSSVLVQDQHTKTWNRTGTVVESKGNKQYLIRLQGSGRISLRTREHLRPCNAPTTFDRQGDNSQLMDEVVSLTPTPQPPPPPRSPGKRKPRPPRWLDDYIV
ncbi:hypothetical protein Pcinc_014248 [Petrolisthes cinctipes]|uniref:Uncharacterized protein n=1 Tax=Petrolisthes cinctipes TaxID=88211 RepID=A0AAE1FY64_PETCI|nr:hypothetical protein Pcinc_014248 [Petrolisthes cinctipes]